MDTTSDPRARTVATRAAAAAGGVVKSADRCLALLEWLAERPRGATYAEVVAGLGLPRSSTHALLQTLLARGYIHTPTGGADERRYRLGLKAAELGAASLRGDDVLQRARPLVAELGAQCGEAVHLAVLDGVEVVYVAAEESEHQMRLVSPLGRRVPAHATASGKVLLAGQDDEEIAARYAAAGIAPEALPRVTERTTGTLADLLREVAEVRALGHGHDMEGYTTGVHAIAAPVRDAEGSVRAALSVAVPTARLDARRLTALAAQVVDAAGRASGTPGSPSPGEPPQVRGRTRPLRIAWSMGVPVVAYREMYQAALTATETLGADLLWSDSYGDEAKQICDVQHLLDARPDVLVLHPVHTVGADALFRRAAAAGVPAICFLRPARSSAFDCFVGADTYREGAQQVEFVAAALGGRGNVVLLEGDPYNDNARNLAEGSHEALLRHPRLRLIADEVCPAWSAETAQRVVGELLHQHGAGSTHNGTRSRTGIHAIICANDAMAGGAAQALAERGLAGTVCLVGRDGDRAGLERLRAGIQHATIFQHPAELTAKTLHAAASLASGELRPDRLPRRTVVWSPPGRPVPALDVPHQLVTRDTLTVLTAYWREAS
jgi:DNA-binding IclR family transcriptional regulator/ABC-type xylose transport system substrate-binding protein